MFYAHIVLAKKGPLARIWLAAHWDKKITKAHVFETNIEQSVEGIMQPKVKLALRTSGHLLLGVVRIYSRKAKYLLADCNEAFVKIKMAFRPGMVDLPEENREAAVNAITLPEVFHDFDTALPELNDVDIEEQFSINQSRADEITMREDYGTLPMSIHDDGFGDMGFDADTPDLARDGLEPNIDEGLFAEELGGGMEGSKEPIPGTSASMLDSLEQHHLDDDGFGDEFGQPAAGLFEGDIFADAPLPTPALPPGAMTSRTESDDDMDHYDGGAPSPALSSYSHPNSPVPGTSANVADNRGPSRIENPLVPLPPLSPAEQRPSDDIESFNPINDMNLADQMQDQNQDNAELNNQEEESFALAPVDATALKGVTKAKRKRKLIVDEVKNISGEEMKSQLANTSDIVTTLDLAPPTKRLMYWKETGGVEKLFALPSRDIPARTLFANYQRHLTSRAFGIEDFSVLGPAEVLALEQNKPEEPEVGRRGRKRKINSEPVLPEPALVESSLGEPDIPREYENPPENVIADQQQFLQNDSFMPPPSVLPPVTPQMHPMLSPGHSLLNSYNMPMTPDVPITPSGAMTPGGIPMTPGNLLHGDLSVPLPTPPMPMHHHLTDDRIIEPPAYDDLEHDDLHNDGMGLDHHGGMTPHHGIENMESIPNLPADQVSSILNEGAGMDNNIGQYANMGFDGPPSSPRVAIANDWNDDYDFPPSVGHQPGEEQQENETDEQFEERVLNKRAAQIFVTIKSRLNTKESIYLSEMTTRNTKKQAAQKFYALLMLKKFQALQIKQDEPYGDILVTRGVMFDNPTL